MVSMANEFDALIKLLRATSEEAVPAAEDAAAVVYRDAARAAAPRKTGQLAASVKIIEGRPRRTLTGSIRNRLFIGPERRKGYYGYWGEHGRKGFTIKPKKARALHWKDASGKDRYAMRANVGPQPKRPWFYASQRGADSQAVQAAESAFNAKMEELNNRIA